MDSKEDVKRKIKFMSFQEKLKAIELIGKGKSQRKIAKELGIGRTTLYNALKNRDKIVEASKKFPEGTNKRRIVSTKHPEIEQAVLDYISESRANGERITGSIIQSYALETASKLEIENFSGSNGWLFSFFKRNNISIKELNGGVSNTSLQAQRKPQIDEDEEALEPAEMISMSDPSLNEIKEEFVYSDNIDNDDYVINWRDWCRVCGNVETLPELEHNILEVVIKLLNLSYDENIKICTECFNAFQVTTEMVNRSKFIENMFIELEEYERDNYVTQDDIISIRDRYDIKNLEKDQSEIIEIIKSEQNCYSIHEEENLEVEESTAQYEEIAEGAIDKDEVWDDEMTIEEEYEEIDNSKDIESLDDKSPKKLRDDDKRLVKKSPDEDMFKYICHICNESFSRMYFLSNHTRKMHKCLPQVACTCGRMLATWDSLMAHKRKHSTEPRNWICDLCNASFITKNGLTIHIKFKHQTEQQLHLCTICGKEFKDGYTLKSHEKTHLPDEERYIHECEFCHKKFTQRGSLKIHISSVHERQKSIICHLCSKGFSSNHYLKIHILTHSIENVRCDICDSVFKNRISLQNHKKKIHKPKDQLKFPCTMCDRRFHNRNHLERHMPTHTGERNFKCTVAGCDVAFKWEKDLRNHLNRHFGERRHRCLWCSREFVDSGNLRKHKIRYHAEELAEFELKYGKRRRMKDLILENDDAQQLAN